jgi:hypothetical protein
MGQAVLRVEGLPENALDAAARFHAHDVPRSRELLRDAQALALVLAPARYDHHGWRLAAVQDLAREAAPKRVNAVVGDDERAIAEALAWLSAAPGITGQLLAVDGNTDEKG